MPSDSEDFAPEYHSREEALSIAAAEASRGLTERADSISYICNLAEFHDYCLCEFVREKEGWIKTIRALTPAERLPGEEIEHSAIVALARSGNMISAVRLYRSKHQVGLKEAVDAVNILRYQPDAYPFRQGTSCGKPPLRRTLDR
jgi:hypothetical protein